MRTTSFTKTLGFLLLAFGLLSFIPGLLREPLLEDPVLRINQGYGRLFGLFPTNIVHNLLFIVLALAAFFASENVVKATSFSRMMALFFTIFALMGLIPGLDTLFGITPFFGHNVWLNALYAVASVYFGFRSVKLQPLRQPQPRV